MRVWDPFQARKPGRPREENPCDGNRVMETRVMKNRSLVSGMVTSERHIAGGWGEDGDWP